MRNIIKAKDKDCVMCGEQAVAFYPVFDPDIKSYPYCRSCLDKERLKFIIFITEMYEGKEPKPNKGAKG